MEERKIDLDEAERKRQNDIVLRMLQIKIDNLSVGTLDQDDPKSIEEHAKKLNNRQSWAFKEFMKLGYRLTDQPISQYGYVNVVNPITDKTLTISRDYNGLRHLYDGVKQLTYGEDEVKLYDCVGYLDRMDKVIFTNPTNPEEDSKRIKYFSDQIERDTKAISKLQSTIVDKQNQLKDDNKRLKEAKALYQLHQSDK